MASYDFYSAVSNAYSESSSSYQYPYYQSQPLLRYNSLGGSSQASSTPNSPIMSYENYTNQSSPYGDQAYEQDYLTSRQPVSSQSYMPAAPRSEASSAGKDWPVFCLFPQCNARPFKRNADLQRHITNTHAPETAKDSYPCDYSKCVRRHEPFHRRDHFRDHLRDYHKEDIGKRGGTIDAEWLRDRSLSSHWWRCSKCLVRVSIAERGFECGQCKTRCEKLRRQRREEESGSSRKSRRRRDT